MLSRKVEDYLDAIYNINLRKGFARTKDIAEELGVKPPTVTEMLKKLDSMGYVKYTKYSGAVLTPEGEDIGRTVKHRHDTLLGFLKKIGVPDELAEKDAHILEHHISPKTIEKIKEFVNSTKNF